MKLTIKELFVTSLLKIPLSEEKDIILATELAKQIASLIGLSPVNKCRLIAGLSENGSKRITVCPGRGGGIPGY
jgi:hypothetical protein